MEIEVGCLHCGESLMDPEHRISCDFPGIKVHVKVQERQGIIWLSSSWLKSGVVDLEVHSGSIQIFDREVVEFYCPSCGREMPEEEGCDECGAPIVLFNLAGSDKKVGLCKRRGCRGMKKEGTEERVEVPSGDSASVVVSSYSSDSDPARNCVI